MNVRPGDLAIKVRGRRIGALVRVLYAAPQRDFVIPDGRNHWAQRPGMWLCESLGAPFSVPRSLGPTEWPYDYVESQYSSISDHMLRPIRGEMVEETREQERAA
jgi:hypothetical protein